MNPRSVLVLPHGGQLVGDKKMHMVIEGPLMRRCGVKMLMLARTGGMPLRLPGIHDCDAVRDRLAEVDRLREGR